VACSIDGCPAPPGIQAVAACLICGSGNHYSSFTRAVMVSMKYLSENEDMEGEISSQYESANDSEDEVDDDDFGLEE